MRNTSQTDHVQPGTSAANSPSRPDVLVVAVDGQLDAEASARVRERLEEALAARPGRIVIDLANCPFVDAAALNMLVDVHHRALDSDVALALDHCSARVLRLLSLTGLRRVFDHA